ncbi:MAG: EamA/RhaT family transporter [Ruminococcaceae bacterium]|nr:EamA/RhaT family transporter [Oscillospiraceae bacterium]
MENKKSRQGALFALILAMSMFGTIGIFRQWIPLPSATVALARSVIGGVFLLLVLLWRRRRPDLKALRRVLWPLLLSGACLGANWLLLFEAYRYTSVATATLCYYMAPILLILLSPLLLRERLTVKRILCVLVALAGMVPVSGVLEADGQGTDPRGVLFGLAAALLYAAVVLLNKRIKGLDPAEKTLFQFAVSALVLLPYVLLTELPLSAAPTLPAWLLLLLVGVVHTGLAYLLYFGALTRLPAQTVAVFSYIDPLLAVLLSAFFSAPLTLPTVVGGVLILGAAIVSER